MGITQDMSKDARGVLVLAVVVLVALAVAQGFKETNLVDNTTADRFITGIGNYGLFVGIVVIALIGFALMRLGSGKKSGG